MNGLGGGWVIVVVVAAAALAGEVGCRGKLVITRFGSGLHRRSTRVKARHKHVSAIRLNNTPATLR